jgi:hypothetical protein
MKLKHKIIKELTKTPFIYRIIKSGLNKLGFYKSDGDNNTMGYLKRICGENNFILEIGTFTGKGTRLMSEKNFVVGIDPFIAGENGTIFRELPLDVCNMFLKRNLGRKIMLLPMTSEKAFNLWDQFVKSKFDIVFVDGMHTYEALQIDMKWEKYLKKDGLLIIHDTDMPEVMRFVKENLIGNKKYRLLDQEPLLMTFVKEA